MMPAIRTKVRQLIDEKSEKLGRKVTLEEIRKATGLQQSILRKYIGDSIINLNKPTLIKLMAYFEKKSITDILEYDFDES